MCLRGAELRDGLPGAIGAVLSAVQKIERLVGHDSLDIEFAVTAAGEVHILQVRPIAVATRSTPIDDDAVTAAVRDAARFVAARAHRRAGARRRLHALQRHDRLEPGRDRRHDAARPRRLALPGPRDRRGVGPPARRVRIPGRPPLRAARRDRRAPLHRRAGLLQLVRSRRARRRSRDPARRPSARDAGRRAPAARQGRVRRPDHVPRAGLRAAGAATLRDAGFSGRDVDELRVALEDLTAAAFTRLPGDLAQLEALRRRLASGGPSPALAPLDRAAWYLDAVRRTGTPVFAHLARAAFVASSLLRGLVEVGAVRAERVDEFLATTETVFGRLQADARRVRDGGTTFDEFVAEYGHLRPGTYDITSPCYAARPEEYLRPLVEHADARRASDLRMDRRRARRDRDDARTARTACGRRRRRAVRARRRRRTRGGQVRLHPSAVRGARGHRRARRVVRPEPGGPRPRADPRSAPRP